MSASPPPPGGISIAWFRIGDLRITDHEPLHQAISSGATTIIPFFSLDDRHLNSVPESLLQLPATGPYRLAAILEAVHSLKTSLNELGSDLITSTGSATETVEQLVTAAAASTSSSSSSTSVSPSHITLHYYPCVVDFDGRLGHHFEQEVTDSFLKAAAAQGIQAYVEPSTLGGGGGTSLLYLPKDIYAIHSTARAAGGDATKNTNDQEDMLHTVVELLDQNPSMTEFRKLIQSTTPVRRPFPPPVAAEMPPLPAQFIQNLQNSEFCGSFKALDRIVEGDSLSWREYYIAAGAEEALNNLEKLVFRGDGGDVDSKNSTFSPAVSYEKRIGGRMVRVQRPPISEKEVQERLDKLFLCGKTSGGGSVGGAEDRDRDSVPPLMDSYRDSRMTASNGLDTSAMLSLSLSLGTLSIRTLYWKTLHAMLTYTQSKKNEEEEGAMIKNTEDSNYLTAFKVNSGGDITKEVLLNPSNIESDTWQWREPTKKDSPGHHWLLMHLGIRDFFSYYAMKSALSLENTTTYSSSISSTNSGSNPPSLRGFDASGPQNRKDLIWSTDKDILSSWAQGNTGFPFVDASMRELAHTGWCSNRGRQNIASFFSKALTIDWRLGEEIFSSLLLDHDFAVNWASWAYVAGVGADPRDRVFKTVTQGEKYDPQGEYIATWVPEVINLEEKLTAAGEAITPTIRHRPWEFPSSIGSSSSNDVEIERESTIIGYPAPIIDPKSQIGKGPPRSAS